MRQAVSGYKPQCVIVDEYTLAMEDRKETASNLVLLKDSRL